MATDCAWKCLTDDSGQWTWWPWWWRECITVFTAVVAKAQAGVPLALKAVILNACMSIVTSQRRGIRPIPSPLDEGRGLYLVKVDLFTHHYVSTGGEVPQEILQLWASKEQFSCILGLNFEKKLSFCKIWTSSHLGWGQPSNFSKPLPGHKVFAPTSPILEKWMSMTLISSASCCMLCNCSKLSSYPYQCITISLIWGNFSYNSSCCKRDIWYTK